VFIVLIMDPGLKVERGVLDVCMIGGGITDIEKG